MKRSNSIERIHDARDLEPIVRILSQANLEVANNLGFTRENAPTNPAFITKESLAKQISPNREFYLMFVNSKAIGTIAIEKAPDMDGVFFIERLAVLPEYQCKGYGEQLMQFAFQRIVEQGGNISSIAIINENITLKKWYTKLGFSETGLKTFDHLPFTVCFMRKELEESYKF